MAVGAAPTLIIVPSERLRILRGLLVAAGAPSGQVVEVEDAVDLLNLTGVTDPVRVVLDIDAFPREDAGLLRRFGDAHRGAELIWIGADVRRHATFELEGLGGRLWAWPVTIDDLMELAGTKSSGGGQADDTSLAESSTPGPRQTAATRPGGAELHRIASILERSGASDVPSSTGQALLAVSRKPDDPSAGRGGIAGASKRRSRAAHAAPRTAYLPSPSVGRRGLGPAGTGSPGPGPAPPGRGHGVNGGASTTGRAAGRSVTGTNGAGADRHGSDDLSEPNGMAFDGPLLSEEEIEAFFAPSVELPPGMEPSRGIEAQPDMAAPEAEPPAGHAAGSATDNDQQSEAALLAPGATGSARPRWLKDQVADLADLVQALDLSARRAHAYVGIEDELARLRQFTRTIGFVASPPARGDQELDLAVMVEEMLGGLAGASPNAPRLLFRKRGASTIVRADKALLACSLDAIFHVAIGCSGSGDVVRVAVEASESAGGADDGQVPDEGEVPRGRLTCRVEFRAGPLAEMTPEEVMQPYALKALLPEIGSNALAAAGAIAVGQGGDLRLTSGDEGQWSFELALSVDSD